MSLITRSPMSLSRSSTCTLSPIKSSSTSLPRTTTNSGAYSLQDTFRLTGNQILVKSSHVNDTFTDFKIQVYDDEKQEECHFVRIVRIGPGIQNKESTVPGALIVIHKSRGVFLEKLSEGYGETYYLLAENDIMTYIDL